MGRSVDRFAAGEGTNKQQGTSNDLGVKVKRLERGKEILREENARVVSQIQNLKEYYTQYYQRFNNSTPGGRPLPGAPGPTPDVVTQPRITPECNTRLPG